MPIIFFGGGGLFSFIFFILFARFILRLLFGSRNRNDYENFYNQYQNSDYFRTGYNNQSQTGSQNRTFRDPYTVLGIPRESSESDIKKAYRKLIREYHPDTVVAKDEAQKEQATKRFREIQEAYETISRERGIK